MSLRYSLSSLQNLDNRSRGAKRADKAESSTIIESLVTLKASSLTWYSTRRDRRYQSFACNYSANHSNHARLPILSFLFENQGFGEQDGVACFHRGLHDIRRLALKVSYFAGNGGKEWTLMRAGNTGKAAFSRL